MRAQIPIVCVATRAPGTGRLAVVSIDTMASGSLAADLLGRFLQGAGKVAVTLSDLAIVEHAERSIRSRARSIRFIPASSWRHPSRTMISSPRLTRSVAGCFGSGRIWGEFYVITEASIPVLNAARDAGMLDKLTVITTDLFPALVEEIRSGSVAATIYQRPRTQGVMAFRVLHEFLVEGECPSSQVTLAPPLATRGNLDFFLQRQSFENTQIKDVGIEHSSAEVGGYSVW